MATTVMPVVLIVDDQPSVRKALRHYFEDSHLAECVEAVNGLDAVEQVRQRKPDLIVLDFSMPVMNGLEAARVINQIDPEIPLLMLTAHLMVATELWARDSGVAAIFSKYNVAPLIQCAKTLLYQQQR